MLKYIANKQTEGKKVTIAVQGLPVVMVGYVMSFEGEIVKIRLENGETEIAINTSAIAFVL